MKPKILIVSTSQWFTTARLAIALANAGCTVEALCPPGNPLCDTKAVSKIHTYRGLLPLTSFERAIARAKPELIVAGDDLAVQQMHRLYNRTLRSGKSRQSICRLIERSLGKPDSFSIVYDRAAFMEVARSEGIRVPKTEQISSAHDLQGWISRAGLPIVLKANGTWGGQGVRIVHTPEEALEAFRALQSPRLFARAAKRALVNRDTTLIWPALLGRRLAVSAQEFVAGREATTLVACWKGAALGSLHFEVLRKQSPAEPATVLLWIDNAEMSAAAEKVVRRLGLSGLHGFDFMLEAQTGNAYMLEINPRATQIGHLTLGLGRDLPAALYASLTGQTVQPARKITDSETITLFPQEWTRDPRSPFLRSGYHDVPWEEPELLRVCLRNQNKASIWSSKKSEAKVLSTSGLPPS